MKKLFATLFAIVAFVAVAIAQTPQEIVSRMETEMGKLEKQGVVMMADAKIPIFGTMTTKTYTLGNKSRSEGAMLGVEIVTWSDGETIWEYNVNENQVQIENVKLNTKSDSKGDLGLFSGVTEEEVTFNADNYPGVTVVDKRQ